MSSPSPSSRPSFCSSCSACLGCGRSVLATQAVAQPDWTGAVLLLMFAYGGFEAPLIPAGEAKDPRRDTGFALLMALGVIAAVYTLVQLVVVGRPAPRGSRRRPSPRPSGCSWGPRGRPGQPRGAGLDLGLLHRQRPPVPAPALLDGGARRAAPASRARARPLPHAPRRDRRLRRGHHRDRRDGTFEATATLSAVVRLVTYGLTCARSRDAPAKTPHGAAGLPGARGDPRGCPRPRLLPLAPGHALARAGTAAPGHRGGGWCSGPGRADRPLRPARLRLAGLKCALPRAQNAFLMSIVTFRDVHDQIGKVLREQGCLGAVLVDLGPLAHIERSFGGAAYQSLRVADRPPRPGDARAVPPGRPPHPGRARGRPLPALPRRPTERRAQGRLRGRRPPEAGGPGGGVPDPADRAASPCPTSGSAPSSTWATAS